MKRYILDHCDKDEPIVVSEFGGISYNKEPVGDTPVLQTITILL
jgi:hypothetical protein